MSNRDAGQPLISIIVLNYNGRPWLERCFQSLEAQSIFPKIEVIVVDNNSPDGSARQVAEWAQQGGQRKAILNEANLYFCEANNVGARAASGKYLFFLNNDLWLEPDCLEVLLRETEAAKADVATPLVLNYEDNTYQALGAPGLDIFGISGNFPTPFPETREIFAACGCTYLIKADLFQKIGEFDAELLMYADEVDLSWRAQIAGAKIVAVPQSRVHHRGAATANPEGQTKIVESRTSDTKRYLANRNGIFIIMKDAQHILLVLLIPHLLLLLVESFAALVLVRRWSYIRKSYWGAIADAIRMSGSARNWRRRIRSFRKHNDFSLLHFIQLKPSRWGEVKRFFTHGVPKVDRK